MIIEIIFLVVLIFVNGIFSATEMAFLSINKYKLNKEIKKGNKKAIKIANLLNDSSSFLSAIQVVITLSGFLASAFATENFAGEIASVIHCSFMTEATLTSLLVVLITLVLSYFTLVFGELLPKKIGLAYSYELAFSMVNVICFVIALFKPFIVILKNTTEFFARFFPLEMKEDKEANLKDTIIDSNLEELEKKLLLNVFEFNDVTLKEVMTPKSDVITIDVRETKEQILERIVKSKYTRFPVVCDGEIIGILNIKDFIINSQSPQILKLIRKDLRLSSSMIIDDAFLLLNANYEPFALVEEEGEYIGIVTMEDILEHIIGDIFDEYDNHDFTKEGDSN